MSDETTAGASGNPSASGTLSSASGHAAAKAIIRSCSDSITMRAEIYWIPDIPSGRLAILGRPRAGDWLADEIADWKAAGITAVVSLLQSHETRELGLVREAEIVEQLGLSFEEFPIPDRGVPESVAAARALGAPDGEAWQRASAARGRPLPDTDGQRLWVANAFSTRVP